MNWRLFKYAFSSADMRKRIFIVFGMLVMYRFLSVIPIPLADAATLRQLIDNLFNSQQLLGFLDLLSGGALSNFSIMLLGLGPYINASIVFQLLTKAIPKLEAINDEGESGRRKINQYTRLLTLPFAILQSIGLVFLVRQQAASVTGIGEFTQSASFSQWALMVGALVGGSMLLMWLGELMTEQGVGNGISLIITAGILSQLPSTIGTIISIIGSEVGSLALPGGINLPISVPGLLLSLLLISVTMAATWFVIKLNEAQRVVKISYAKRVQGNRAYGGVDSVLPIKLITVGVIPVIFAVAFLSVPAFAGQIMQSFSNPTLQSIGTNLLDWFGNTQGLVTSNGGIELASFIYPGIYFALVVMFTYFYTSIMFNPKELAENLQQQGGFIAGIRPGANTEKYLARIVSRLTLFGAVSLGLLAILPYIIDFIVFQFFTISNSTLSQQLTLGGTGLIILVSVAIETLRQIESRALMVSFDAEDQE